MQLMIVMLTLSLSGCFLATKELSIKRDQGHFKCDCMCADGTMKHECGLNLDKKREQEGQEVEVTK